MEDVTAGDAVATAAVGLAAAAVAQAMATAAAGPAAAAVADAIWR